ncbi:hypothetical protein L1887_02083 [Cichorium endivia]|nr:hypothetical protein L1887_02083 [Cichorium endivia]
MQKNLFKPNQAKTLFFSKTGSITIPPFRDEQEVNPPLFTKLDIHIGESISTAECRHETEIPPSPKIDTADVNTKLDSVLSVLDSSHSNESILNELKNLPLTLLCKRQFRKAFNRLMPQGTQMAKN